jgi:hypothetical protein
MKKIRIMLLSFTLLAVVGGAFAFRANFLVKYCTTDANENPTAGFCTFDASNNKTCPDELWATTILPAQDPIIGTFCYTTPQDIDGQGGVECKVGTQANQCLNNTRTFWDD